MRFITGVLTGLVLGFVVPASATVVEPDLTPEGMVDYHPSGTIPTQFLPAACRVLKSLHFEERNTRLKVREILVVRLECETGDRRRTLIARGPWLNAYVPAQ